MSAVVPDDPPLRQVLWEWTKAILVAIVIWGLVRTFLFEAFRIPSGSMEGTLLVGDFLFVNKAIYGAEVPGVGWRLPAFREPARGDVLVFDSVEEPEQKVVKRLVGLPGDTLSMRGGRLFRDGMPVDEPYVRHVNLAKSESPEARTRMRAWQLPHLATADTADYRPDLQDWGPVVVPADSLFVMGDNRDLSYDGRYWGFLPRGSVRGTPVVIYYSYESDSWKRWKVLTTVRWSRILSHPH